MDIVEGSQEPSKNPAEAKHWLDTVAILISSWLSIWFGHQVQQNENDKKQSSTQLHSVKAGLIINVWFLLL